jgi:hypothetical protein
MVSLSRCFDGLPTDTEAKLTQREPLDRQRTIFFIRLSFP